MPPPLALTDAPPELPRLLHSTWRSMGKRAEGKPEVARLLGESPPRSTPFDTFWEAFAWSTGGVLGALVLSAILQAALSSTGGWLQPLALLAAMIGLVSWRFSQRGTAAQTHLNNHHTVRDPVPSWRDWADAKAHLLAFLAAIPGHQLGCDAALVFANKAHTWALSLEPDGAQLPVAWVALRGALDQGALEIGLHNPPPGAAPRLQTLLRRPATAALLAEVVLPHPDAAWQEWSEGPARALVLRLPLRDRTQDRADAQRTRRGIQPVPVDPREDPAVALAAAVTLLLRDALTIEAAAPPAEPLAFFGLLPRRGATPQPLEQPAASWTLPRASAPPQPWEPPDRWEELTRRAAADRRTTLLWGTAILGGITTLTLLLIWLLYSAWSEATIPLLALGLWGAAFTLEALVLQDNRATDGTPRAVGVGCPRALTGLLAWDGARRLSLDKLILNLDAPFQLQLSREPAPNGAASTHLGVTLLQRAPDGAPLRLTLEIPGLALDDNTQQLPLLELDAPRCPPELWMGVLWPLLEGPLAAHGALPAWTLTGGDLSGGAKA